MNVLYRTEATASGGRTGTVASADGAFRAVLVTPKELGGAGGAGTNPEQLFASGYAACFLGALKFVAGQRKVRVAEESSVTAASSSVARKPISSSGALWVIRSRA